MKYLFLVLFFLGLNTPAMAARKAFVPPEGNILLLVGQDRATIDAYVDATKKTPAGFMVYTSLRDLEGVIAPPLDRGAGFHDPNYLIGKYPHTVLQMGLYMVGLLDEASQGGLDWNIKALAGWCKKVRVPVYLRIGYEFDLPQNAYDPSTYVAVYRRIVDIFKKEHVENVAFVWHSYGVMNVSRPMEQWYPGDAYVDWVAVSYFLPEMKSLKAVAAFSRLKGKPFMIAEATPQKAGTHRGEKSWAFWFKELFEFIKQENVRVLCYINSDWLSLPMFKDEDWSDARIQADPYVKAAWMKETGNAKYLQSSPLLFYKLGFHPRMNQR